MYKIKVNDKFNFDVDTKGESILLNNKPLDVSIRDFGSNLSHIIYNNKSFNTEIVEINKIEKFCVIKVNGNRYKIDIEDQFEQLLKQMGLDKLVLNKVAEIKAPMPGLVLAIKVSEGEEVKKGDNLLVLEAMKMENILKSPADGVINKILVKQNDKVEKNQILIQFK
ncbi:acetyl-CoA carboxylase biotin carboxyl carrier protein subunit [Pedobacter sp. Leaf176]|uniref:acetyl-CoA carboxylase biotin carboxyl carrier protein subunit n=1 Tax=Pedobacter sp. Leaf176 TaxID=1736286 RepID=UPI0006F94753|nr:acetyl-CoA carboxylase biotin carboxyl carrier protein subunit [Pedobacter sp. Leaf176]KQR72045.1 carboxylesterase [Pedobacter sp. Leaf176]